MDPGDERKNLQEIWHIEHLTVFDEHRDNKGNGNDGRDDVTDTLERVDFRVWKDEAAEDSEKVVGRDTDKDVPEMSAALDVMPVLLVVLWTRKIASLH